MVAISILEVQQLFPKFIADISDFHGKAIAGLEDIQKKGKGKLTKGESDYLSLLIKDLDKIIIATPDEIAVYIRLFGIVPKSVAIKGKRGRKPKSFKDKILAALAYKFLRSSFYPKYFSKIGIKSCVYCNSQLAVSIDSVDFTKSKTPILIKAKFQVDHYHSKNDYPGLSISLFNLYPVCGSCNIAKSSNPVDFVLYSNDLKKRTVSDYRFELAKGCVAKYLVSKKIEHLKINFIDPKKLDPLKLVKGSFQDTFDIQGIYDTQIDLIEELIWKAEAYNKTYKKILIKSFSKLFTNASLSNRILIGNYHESTMIHKRPMAKLTQDIARQLNLI